LSSHLSALRGDGGTALGLFYIEHMLTPILFLFLFFTDLVFVSVRFAFGFLVVPMKYQVV